MWMRKWQSLQLIIATNFRRKRQTVWNLVTQKTMNLAHCEREDHLMDFVGGDAAVTPDLAPVTVIININIIIIIIIITFWGEKDIMFLVFCCKVLNTKKTNQHKNVKWYFGRKRSCQPDIMFLISFLILFFLFLNFFFVLQIRKDCSVFCDSGHKYNACISCICVFLCDLFSYF